MLESLLTPNLFSLLSALVPDVSALPVVGAVAAVLSEPAAQDTAGDCSGEVAASPPRAARSPLREPARGERDDAAGPDTGTLFFPYAITSEQAPAEPTPANETNPQPPPPEQPRTASADEAFADPFALWDAYDPFSEDLPVPEDDTGASSPLAEPGDREASPIGADDGFALRSGAEAPSSATDSASSQPAPSHRDSQVTEQDLLANLLRTASPVAQPSVSEVDNASFASNDSGVVFLSSTPIASLPTAPGPALDKDAVLQAFHQKGLRFETNVGQFDSSIDFVARGSNYSVALTSAGAVLALTPPRDAAGAEAVTVGMEIVGGNPDAAAVGQGVLPGITNYLSGDPSQTFTRITSYAQAVYRDIYDGIDLVYRTSTATGQLEYDFVVAPGANPGQVALAFHGTEGVTINGRGELVLRTALGDLVQQAPFTYQDIGGVRYEVASRFTLDDAGHVRFTLGAYDSGYTLTMDPSYHYSSYLGGTAGDEANAVAFSTAGGTDGRVFVVGATSSPTFRPADPGRAAITPRLLPAGGPVANSAFVIAVNPADDTQAHYLTYLTGAGTNVFTSATSVVADNFGVAYIAGRTTSGMFYTRNAWQNQLGGGEDAFAVALLADGTDAAYSTYLGGAQNDVAWAIARDGSGNVFIAGRTASNAFNNRQPDATFGPLGGAASNAFVVRLTAQGALDSLVLIGGAGVDVASGIAVGQGGGVYVTGWTFSNNLLQGVMQPAPFQNALNGTSDAFVAKLTYGALAAPTLAFLTYFGGDGTDVGRAIAVDVSTGIAYVVGDTTSNPNNGWGTGGNTIQPFVFGASGGNSDAWVAEFDADGSPQGPPLGLPYYFAYIAGTLADYGTGVALVYDQGDSPFYLYVVGWTNSKDDANGRFPTKELIRLQEFNRGLSDTAIDGFLAHLDPRAATYLASQHSVSYIGGGADDQALGVAVDTITATRNAWVAGHTLSDTFRAPVASGLQTVYGGGGGGGDGDGFVVSVIPDPPPLPPAG